MKSVHKQIFVFVVMWAGLFGATAYFALEGIHGTRAKLAEHAALLVAAQMQPMLEAALVPGGNAQKVVGVRKERLNRALLGDPKRFGSVENVRILDAGGRVVFTLHPTGSPEPPVTRPADNLSEIRVTRGPGHRLYEAVVPLAEVQPGLRAVLTLNFDLLNVRKTFHSALIKFYLLGLAGLLVMILTAVVSRRIVRSPMKAVERAMNAIDRRKYRYRLRSKSDDEFHGLYQKVNQALERLEQLDTVQRKAVHQRNKLERELKDNKRFLDVMAHEIKNPLHAMGINLDVLKTKIGTHPSGETAMKHIDLLEQEMDHLREVVRGFLNFVRPGVPQKQRTRINEVIRAVCEMVSAQAEEAQVNIETRLSRSLPEVLVDRGQFQQALHNVVLNAIQATSKQGKINIRSRQKRGKVLVAVKDSGVGIPKEELKKIFDLYYTTKKGGTGLGLPVTKRLIEANGGEMQIDSKPGKGTTVTVMLPA